MKYICAHCGTFAAVPEDVEMLDSGTTLICDSCGEPTVVDLGTPAYRVKLFKDAGRLKD